MELAGVVVAVGDRVRRTTDARSTRLRHRRWRRASNALRRPANTCSSCPSTLPSTEAGGFAEAFTTAYDALVTQGHLRAGKRVLISGAAGGVGVAAVQIAHVLGAHVIAVTRTTSSTKSARS